MITLVDTYNQSSWDLHYSLVRSGYNHPMIAIVDDGFLPDDVTSPYLHYTGFEGMEGRPLYFNEVRVPEFWEISADNSKGEIFNFSRKRGHIHYAEPKHLRLVKAVDWHDDTGKLRVTDRYNKFGYRFAQSIYNLNGEMTYTTYYNKNGKEVIVENHQTGDLILNQGEKVKLFKTRHEFVRYYLTNSGYNLDRIFYNSLSTPFLVTYYLGGEGRDILFWQEDIYQEIPGNMRLLLDGQSRDTKVLVQSYSSFEKMQPLLSEQDKQKVDFLGYLYPMEDKKKPGNDVLILTNSDQLEAIDFLVENHPQLHFHIAALTEMSSNLTRLSRFHHVSLYPNIAVSRARELYKLCSVYLDINHGNEILSAVRAAFEQGLLIFAFDVTAHQLSFTTRDCVFKTDESHQLSAILERVLSDELLFQTYLEQQAESARLETTDRYQELIG